MGGTVMLDLVRLYSALRGDNRRMAHVTLPLALAASVLAATPVMAQERILTIFGDDKCPADTICVVGKEEDRYRIPKGLREPVKRPDSTSWAVRSQATLAEGKEGIGSCSSTGAGGWTGCWTKYMQQMREDAKAQKAAARDVP